jgi:hypothetical protein
MGRLMTSWKRYTQLEPVKRLDYEGRELLGKTVYITVKRDGENVSPWLDETDTPHISSHNNEEADSDIQNRFKATPEYPKAVELLLDEKNTWHNDCILYGELLKCVSPTRIERTRKNIHWILFDIYSKTEGKYMDYTQVYMKGYHFHIPVVKLIDTIIPTDMNVFFDQIAKYKTWCKRHRREGIVGKCYENQVFFKEKIDLPEKPKLVKPTKFEISYPPMPEETITRALEHAIDQVGVDNWLDRSKSMPVLAQHLATEASEHYFSVPRNFYNIYLDSLVNDKYRNI